MRELMNIVDIFRGRIIDVSTSVARALGMIDAGVVPVLVEAVEETKAAVGREAKQEIFVPQNAL